MSIVLYADGACSGNHVAGGGVAGAAVVVLQDGSAGLKEIARRQMNLGRGTNQTAELAAATMALDIIHEMAKGEGPRPSRFTVRCDSEYVVKGINEWMAGWERNGWRTSGKKPVANVDLWRQIKSAYDGMTSFGITIRFEWVKGHANDRWNNLVDELAVAAVRRPVEPKPQPAPPAREMAASPVRGVTAERWQEIADAMVRAGRGDGNPFVADLADRDRDIAELGVRRAIAALERLLAS